MKANWNPDKIESLVDDLEKESSQWVTRESIFAALFLGVGGLIWILSSGSWGSIAAIFGFYSLGLWEGMRNTQKEVLLRLEDKCVDVEV